MSLLFGKRPPWPWPFGSFERAHHTGGKVANGDVEAVERTGWEDPMRSLVLFSLKHFG